MPSFDEKFAELQAKLSAGLAMLVAEFPDAAVRMREVIDGAVAEVGTYFGGTGATRSVRLGVSTNGTALNRYIQVQGAQPFVTFGFTNTGSSGSIVSIGDGGTFQASSSTQNALGNVLLGVRQVLAAAAPDALPTPEPEPEVEPEPEPEE